MRVSILGGAYQAQSLIAGAQRSINLYPEINSKSAGEPVPVTHYPRPGLTLLNPAPSPGRGRALYAATNGDLFALVDQTLYYISPDWVFTALGSLVAGGSKPASMADNGTDLVLVDGSPQGYDVKLKGHAFSQIGDPNFLGADRVDYVDGFLVFNQPGTIVWYASDFNKITFQALDFGAKTAFPDNIVAIICCHRVVWLLGSKKGEVWYNAGAQGFPFQAAPGTIVEQGCGATFSVAKQDTLIYWLSQSPEGDRMVMKGGSDYGATRISTHAIEAEFRTYPRVDDAIGACYQQSGHAFYKLHFPTADRTWVYDEATEEWHERRSCDANGVLHRERDAFCAFAYGVNVALDWSTGSLYALDPTNSTDQILAPGNVPNAGPIVCIRSMPHQVGEDFQRIRYDSLIADIQVGTQPGTTTTAAIVSPWSGAFSSGFGPQSKVAPPLISLRWSDTRGASWGTAMLQAMGAAGRYRTNPKWSRLGIARDRVFELSWSAPMRTALNGVFLEAKALRT